MCTYKYDFLKVKRAGKMSNLHLSNIMIRSIPTNSYNYYLKSSAKITAHVVWSRDILYTCVLTLITHTHLSKEFLANIKLNI